MDPFDNAVRNRFEPIESYSFVCKTEESEIISKTFVPVCSEVVNNFYHFMLGSGFSNKSILESFEQIIDQNQ